MAKTLNQFLEGYLKVKNPDEQKFVDKHVVAKHADRNGNDDEVFKGSKVKPIDRRKDRHGYNPGEDEKVYEELKGNQHKIDANKNGKVDAHDFKLLRKKKKVAEEAEQIDELSKETKASYMKKAGGEIDKLWNKSKTDSRSAHKYYGRKNTMKKIAFEEVEAIEENVGAKIADLMRKKSATTSPIARKNIDSQIAKLKRQKAGMAEEAEQTDILEGGYRGRMAQISRDARQSWIDDRNRRLKDKQKMSNEPKKTNEEAEQVDEKLTAKTPMKTYIKDFQKSDAPQFKGKSQEKRRVMAIAAKLTAERGGKPLRKEEKLADLLGDLSESHRRTMLSVFDKLNEDNQKKFLEACQTEEGVEHMLDFAISHRGE